MIPTSARRRRLLLNLLPRPLLILQVQSDLALVHCPSINRNNPEGETNKQTSNTCASDKGKQKNKQISRGGTCRGTDAGGSVELHNMQSPICNASEYVEELRRCIRDASEMHRKSTEFDMQGCTLTIVQQPYCPLHLHPCTCHTLLFVYLFTFV